MRGAVKDGGLTRAWLPRGEDFKHAHPYPGFPRLLGSLDAGGAPPFVATKASRRRPSCAVSLGLTPDLYAVGPGQELLGAAVDPRRAVSQPRFLRTVPPM